MVSYAYLRLLIFLLAILIPACATSSLAFHMMCSACKLNKQGDSIQPGHTPFPILNRSIVSCPVLMVASWPAYRFLRSQVRWSGIHISWRIFQFVVMHTVKGFSVVNEAEVDVFLECPCFLCDPVDVTIEPFFGIGMKIDLFQSCGHCWIFQICRHIECSTFTASSFRILNTSAEIPSPPLALFLSMFPKAYLTSHSRVSGSGWVITPSWLSGSLGLFWYSSVYSCHLFLISC